MIYTPDMNDGLHVFVFGSNLAGRHGAGAALQAVKHWGATYGVGIGLSGQSYAIPTKDEYLRTLPLPVIERDVSQFVRKAAECPYLTFLVTKIGCGLAGYSEKDIAPMFRYASPNCVLPEGWRAAE